ncbi:DUF4097 family beta strand repeat-containing protein [Roseivirga misakiensis]|uniref:DUF4097 domain-containing protein n=1 Tax=Roseivirga misakiensis TaxID=1563681 RepID=A0A1E5T4J5_9BACT|nr:DUF4097 family beta strand repeat-containing protein [Roseivirga misakiensis]OEK06276.1 hypothetical protein BFP71_00950 [Roseivirga misakiensis]
MKRIINIALLMMLSIGALIAQRDSETITKSLKVKDNSKEFWFAVCNINGNVDVEAYSGNTIEIELKKQISARSADNVRAGMEEVKMLISEGDDFAKVNFEFPDQKIREKDDPLDCGWDWNGNRRKSRYSYLLDYKIKVPNGISVKISTVNEGDVSIRNVEGEIYAGNVNGDITLINIESNTKASTVNGVIEAVYTKMPSEFGSFNTVNGDILLEVPSKSSGVYNFQTQWGKVYSDLDFDSKVAPKVMKTSSGKGTKYKISNSNGYQMGKGGPSMEFETLNGDIRIRKK